jgi:hypothetical protein
VREAFRAFFPQKKACPLDGPAGDGRRPAGLRRRLRHQAKYAAIYAAIQIGDHHKGFVITWVEPPVSAHKWVLNINAEDKAGLTKLGRTEVIKGATLDEAMAKAKKFIEEL